AGSGALLWGQSYHGSGCCGDIPSALGVSPDGSKVFITGRSGGSGTGDDYATVAYDATTGARQWVKRYNGEANGTDDAYDLAVSPDGSQLFVTGRSLGSGSGDDYATVSYDPATGARQWLKRYNGP